MSQIELHFKDDGEQRVRIVNSFSVGHDGLTIYPHYEDGTEVSETIEDFDISMAFAVDH